jgi:hypothetical protein
MDSRVRTIAAAAGVPALLVTGVVAARKPAALKRFLRLDPGRRRREACVTPVDMAKAVAAEHGYFGCTDDEADFALRERTAFPDAPVGEVADQLDRYFANQASRHEA